MQIVLNKKDILNNIEHIDIKYYNSMKSNNYVGSNKIKNHRILL
jgi:hypothetical protein